VFNFVLAVVVYWLMFIVGVDGLRPIVGEVEEGSAAARSGLANGDLVLRVDERQTPTWEAVTIEVLERVLDGEPVTLTVRTPEGDTVVKSLDLTDAPPLKARGNVLSNLGLTPGLPPLDPVIDEVVADSPAAAAGLAPGDRVVTTDGEPIASWYDWVKIVRANPGRPLEVEVLRGGQRIALTLTPKAVDEDGETMGQVGAGPRTPDDFEATWRASLRYGPGEAFLQAMGKTYDMTVLTLRLLGKMVTGQATLANLSGPISIAQYAGQSASIGLGQFLAFLGLVSLSLGVLNLLPVPVLDGGHLLYYLIEFVKGSPVSEDALIWGQKVGIALLVGLMTLALYNDLTRLLGQ
jgi:regulator of sigma E protease